MSPGGPRWAVGNGTALLKEPALLIPEDAWKNLVRPVPGGNAPGPVTQRTRNSALGGGQGAFAGLLGTPQKTRRHGWTGWTKGWPARPGAASGAWAGWGRRFSMAGSGGGPPRGGGILHGKKNLGAGSGGGALPQGRGTVAGRPHGPAQQGVGETRPSAAVGPGPRCGYKAPNKRRCAMETGGGRASKTGSGGGLRPQGPPGPVVVGRSRRQGQARVNTGGSTSRGSDGQLNPKDVAPWLDCGMGPGPMAALRWGGRGPADGTTARGDETPF